MRRIDMFAHFTQGSNNLPRAIQFYDALLAPLDVTRRESTDNSVIVAYHHRDSAHPVFFVVAPLNEKPATAGNGSMVAFQANSTSAVDLSYQAGMDKGGSDEGPPGPRPQYDDKYYGAYLRDPDGNKVHIVCRGNTDQD